MYGPRNATATCRVKVNPICVVAREIESKTAPTTFTPTTSAPTSA